MDGGFADPRGPGMSSHSPWAPPGLAGPAALTGVPDPRAVTGPGPHQGWPGRDRSGGWLRLAAVGLCVLAAGAAVVSFTAQYRMIYAARRAGGDRRAGGRDPRRGRVSVRLAGHRAGPAPAACGPAPGAERRLGRHQCVHERDRRRAGLAERGDLGDAAGRLRAGVATR